MGAIMKFSAHVSFGTAIISLLQTYCHRVTCHERYHKATIKVNTLPTCLRAVCIAVFLQERAKVACRVTCGFPCHENNGSHWM